MKLKLEARRVVPMGSENRVDGRRGVCKFCIR